MPNDKENKNYIRASAKVLKSNNFRHLEAIKTSEEKGGEEMTSNEMYQLLKWLKKEGYTFEQAINLIKRIAEKKIDDNDQKEKN